MTTKGKEKEVFSLTEVYVWLMVVFGVFTVVMVILGEVFDFVGHFFDWVGGIFDGLSGGHDLDGADAGHDADGGSPSPFSFRTISSFLMGFGAGGYIGKYFGFSDAISLVPACSTGLTASVLVWLVLKMLYSQQGTTSIQAADYIGLTGRIIVSIPGGEDRMGQMAVIIKGERNNMPVISAGGAAIPNGTEVFVVSMEGGTPIVQKLIP